MKQASMELTYTRCGDVLFPDLCVSEEPEAIGRYGLLRKSYLKDNNPGLYSNLLLTGKLDRHLAEIDRACNGRVELITNQLAKREGVTEALKAKNQMEWVRQMNGIRARAEEVILSELIYC